MAYLITSPEYLEVDGVPLQTPGWTHINLADMWAPANTRGQDRLIPGATGVRSKRRRRTVTPRSIVLTVFGDANWDGDPYSNQRVGLETNWQHLETNVIAPVDSMTGTRPAILHLPSGATKTGAIHIERVSLSGDGENLLTATIDISIPGGELT